MNESISFEKYEKSSLFGYLSFCSNKNKLSTDCGQLIQSFKGHQGGICSIQTIIINKRIL